jgi:hypothetical protein
MVMHMSQLWSSCWDTPKQKINLSEYVSKMPFSLYGKIVWMQINVNSTLYFEQFATMSQVLENILVKLVSTLKSKKYCKFAFVCEGNIMQCTAKCWIIGEQGDR